MRPLPVAEPGVPETRSAARFLWWLARLQWRTVGSGMGYGTIGMLVGAVLPYVLSRGTEAVIDGDRDELLRWCGAFLVLGVIQAVAGIMRHRNAVFNWLSASFRTSQVTVAQANRLGATLPKRLATGDVVAIGANDTAHIGNALDITARGSAAVASLVVVTAILLHASVTMGLVVLLGVPVLMLLVGVLIRPLHRRQSAYREQQGSLTGRATDIVAGLRVLRGIGGESVFGARYRGESQRLRTVGVRAAQVDSLLEATHVLMPGLFLALVTWIGARLVVAGEIQAYQLVAFYGYAAFLVTPIRTLAEALEKLTRGHVAAGRVLTLLRLRPDIADPDQPTPLPEHAPLTDVASGVTVRPGVFTALVTEHNDEAAAIADRLGRYTDGDVRFGGVSLRDATRSAVRAAILVCDNDARLFTGALRQVLDPRGTASDLEIRQALEAACALDVLDALPGGLDELVAERGREFSGGQQQRLRLARALLAQAPVLVLVEPTSAVDAHTEARIAERLGAARAGLTTLVTTSSPLVLDRADHVVLVLGGKVAAEGTHRDLLATHAGYRAVVARTEEPASDRPAVAERSL